MTAAQLVTCASARLHAGGCHRARAAVVSSARRNPLLSLCLLHQSRGGSSSSNNSSTANAKAHVLAIATEYRQEAAILERSAKLLGYRFSLCGLAKPWQGWATKFLQYREDLQKDLATGAMQSQDPVLLVDGWDTMLLGSAAELRHKLDRAPYSMVSVPWCAAERLPGPDFFLANRIDAITPDLKTPWRYPNAGAIVGRASSLLKLLEDLLDEGQQQDGVFAEDWNDQGRLHEHLLERGEAGAPLPYHVDSRCGIFQCLYEAEAQWEVEDRGEVFLRLRNTLTGERPILLHGNGHTGRWFLTGLWRELNTLERAGLTPGDLAHLPHDGPTAPGATPDEATTRDWNSTFDLFRIYEKQLEFARQGIRWDPWKGIMEQVPPR